MKIPCSPTIFICTLFLCQKNEFETFNIFVEVDKLRVFYISPLTQIIPYNNFLCVLIYLSICLSMDELSAKDNNSEIPLNMLGFCCMSHSFKPQVVVSFSIPFQT